MTGLRPYQSDVIHSIGAHRTEGARRVLVVMATGLGKTRTATSYAAHIGARTLWIVHREELIEQAVDAFRLCYSTASIGVIANTRHQADAHVVVASVQTLRQQSRLDRLEGAFDLVIIDEAHHVRPPKKISDGKPTNCSYTTIVEHLAAGQMFGGPFVIGLTATPMRLDRRSVVGWFDDRIACNLDIRWAIEHQHLVDIRAVRIRTGVRFDDLTTRNGDWADGELGRALIEDNVPARVVTTWLELAEGRSTVVFSPTLEMSRIIAERFQAVGIAAEHVDGTTPKDERRAIMHRVQTGATTILSNVGVATEGWDCPIISCAVMARPTKSTGLYVQMIGRALRLAPGKVDALILDVAGASETNQLVLASDVLGLHRALADHERARDVMAQQDGATAERAEADEQQRLLEAEQSWTTGPQRMADVDVMGRPKGCRHIWTHAPIDGCTDRWTHDTTDGTVIVVRRGPADTREWVAGANTPDKPVPIMRHVLITEVMRHAEEWIDGHRDANAWRTDPPTVKQTFLLERLGVQWRTIAHLTKAKAGVLISRAKADQERLRKHNADIETRAATGLNVISADAITAVLGERFMINEADVAPMLGVHVPANWEPEAIQRSRSALDVLESRGRLRRQGESYVVIHQAS